MPEVWFERGDGSHGSSTEMMMVPQPEAKPGPAFAFKKVASSPNPSFSGNFWQLIYKHSLGHCPSDHCPLNVLETLRVGHDVQDLARGQQGFHHQTILPFVSVTSNTPICECESDVGCARFLHFTQCLEFFK